MAIITSDINIILVNYQDINNINIIENISGYNDEIIDLKFSKNYKESNDLVKKND